MKAILRQKPHSFLFADHPGPIAWWHTLAQLRRDMAVFFLCTRGSDPLHLNRERESREQEPAVDASPRYV